MKRILFLVLLSLMVLSCSKQTSELKITQDRTVEEKEVVADTVDSGERKPLINITKDDTLKIMVRADGAPGMYLDSDGELKGFYVELEKEIMKEMGQKYELISYTDLGPLIQQMKEGTAHNALATPNLPDYASFLNLSINYEILNYVIFLNNQSESIESSSKEEAIKSLFGKKIGVQTRGHIYQALRDYKDIEIAEYPTTTVAMEALNNGEVYAVPEVKRIGKYYAKKNSWSVKPIGAPIITQRIATGFSQALDPSVIDRYNVALQSLLDSGYVDRLHKSYFGE